MVLSAFLVPVFFVPIFGRGAIPAPKGLGPQKPSEMLAHWGSLTAPTLSRNQVSQKMLGGFLLIIMM